MQILTSNQIRNHLTPKGCISLWWLGQSGFIAKTPNGIILALDPYLTNSCQSLGELHGFNFNRQVPPPMLPEELAVADLLLFTHSHQDHCDPQTIAASRQAGSHGPYLAPPETITKLHSLNIPPDETVMVWPNKCHTQEDVTICATFAIPLGADDLTHVGYLLSVKDGPTVYFTGDTGWHDVLAEAVAPHRPDVLVTVINPAFRNLSPAEAAQLARRLNVKVVIPCHHDLFPDNCQPPQLLHTNLKLLGIGETYRLLSHGETFVWPSSSNKS